jgi:hypothetical protein
MGRPKGSKNTTKANKNGIGHNGSALTEDESRALTLHHKRLYEAADALVEKAKADRKAVADLAKADLGKGAVADIKDLIAAGDDKKIKAKLDRELRIARLAGIPIGFQVDMFADRRPAEDKWAAEGRTAGMAGERCEPPAHLSPSAVQIWIEAWHGGQAVLASAFAKKKPEPVSPPNGDFSDPPFGAPNEPAAA